MAVRSVSSESISDHCDGSRSIHDYSRQATVHGASCPTLYREPRARALVRRPSVDFIKLTKQRSRAIIDNYFKATSPPVLEHMSKETLKKISDTEMGKVLTLRYCMTMTTPTSFFVHSFLFGLVAFYRTNCAAKLSSTKPIQGCCNIRAYCNQTQQQCNRYTLQ